MKIKIILSLATIIFLSSCANKFSLTKRKYTKGYYFSSAKKSKNLKNETSNIDIDQKKLIVKNVQLNSDKSIADKSVKTALIINQPSNEFVIPLIDKKLKHSSTGLTASLNKKNTSNLKPIIKPIKEKQIFNSKTKKDTNDSDLIVQIILSLFPIFCLIGIFLHDGKDITLNFWIDLLLHLTIYGCCIFAILVVLDVIDLK